MASSTAVRSGQLSHDGRTYHGEGEKYVLPVDVEEHERLRLQHKVIKTAGSGKVFFPPYDSTKGYLVLDVGVGPAAWLLDVASEMSSTSILHGIDVENRQFPQERPPNMSFSVASVLTLPDAWEKSFHFAHQRLLVGALKSSEWPLAIDQLYRVLKPGGWVQLGEFGEWAAELGPDSACFRHKEIHYGFFNSRGLDLSIYKSLPGLLKNAGFVNVRVDVLHIPMGNKAGPAGVDGARNLLSLFRALKEPIVRLGTVSSEAKYEELIDEVEKEWNALEDYKSEFHIIIAQRPLID